MSVIENCNPLKVSANAMIGQFHVGCEQLVCSWYADTIASCEFMPQFCRREIDSLRSQCFPPTVGRVYLLNNSARLTHSNLPVPGHYHIIIWGLTIVQ